MSADGNVKFSFAPRSSSVSVKTTSSRNERICAFCGQPLAGEPPVLLKSGQSVHLECYLHIRQSTGSAGKAFRVVRD